MKVMVCYCVLLGGFLAAAGAEDLAASPTAPEMVLVPGGTFLMGKDGYADFSPQHEVQISPFYMDKTEVTCAQYAAYCESTGTALPDLWGIEEFHCGSEYPDHPVVGVTHSAAQAYARWRGCRLPTEAEWEYAARGGLVDKNYSLGDEMDSTLYVRGNRGTFPVASFPENGYGLFDMTSNVGEWIADWYGEHYYAVSTKTDPTGPGQGLQRVIRGGGWHTGPYCSRVYYRACLKSNWVDFNLGFRCVKYMGESAALRVESLIREAGIERALAAYREMKRGEPGAYYFDEAEFNEVGYRLLGSKRVDEAVAVLRLNVEAYPHSFNAFDSLGEAYMIQGDKERAIENYRKSIELNPRNMGGRNKLKELTED